jgi:hypothetical protein
MGVFWLFGVFFVPLAAIFIDWIEFFGKMLFKPTDTMLFREFELEDKFNNLQMLTCISGPGVHHPTSEQISNELGIEVFALHASLGSGSGSGNDGESGLGGQRMAKPARLAHL